MSRSWISPIVLTTMLLAAVVPAAAVAAACPGDGVWLQVLGSGGPETNDGRASSSYLVWHDGHARVLVDIGSGSMVHFDRSGARIEDLSVVLLSHLHVDHSNDLPALVKGSYFIDRTTDLPLYGVLRTLMGEFARVQESAGRSLPSRTISPTDGDQCQRFAVRPQSPRIGLTPVSTWTPT